MEIHVGRMPGWHVNQLQQLNMIALSLSATYIRYDSQWNNYFRTNQFSVSTLSVPVFFFFFPHSFVFVIVTAKSRVFFSK